MGKLQWHKPTLISFTTESIQSGDVCLGYEAAMGTAVPFYTVATGLQTVNGGCSSFTATGTCSSKNIKLANGNSCAPAISLCS